MNIRILEEEGLKTDEVEKLKKESELFVQELNDTTEYFSLDKTHISQIHKIFKTKAETE